MILLIEEPACSSVPIIVFVKEVAIILVNIKKYHLIEQRELIGGRKYTLINLVRVEEKECRLEDIPLFQGLAPTTKTSAKR